MVSETASHILCVRVCVCVALAEFRFLRLRKHFYAKCAKHGCLCARVQVLFLPEFINISFHTTIKVPHVLRYLTRLLK